MKTAMPIRILLAASFLAFPAANAYAVQTCNGKGVKVSGALGVSGDCVGSAGQNPIFALLSLIIKASSVILGLVLVGIVVYAGILYIVSGGQPNEVEEAKNRLKAAVTALVLYALMFAILQAVIPGGIFR